MSSRAIFGHAWRRVSVSSEDTNCFENTGSAERDTEGEEHAEDQEQLRSIGQRGIERGSFTCAQVAKEREREGERQASLRSQRAIGVV